MYRLISFISNPEVVLLLSCVLLFLFCLQHNSGEGHDVELMEKLIWALPFILTPISFSTILATDAKSWWWLLRAIVFTYLAIFICGYQLISALGSGSKGQDVAFILLIVTGTVAIAIATAITSVMILSATQPAFAIWFHTHRALGILLVILSTVLVGCLLGLVTAFLGGILLGFYVEIFKH